MAKLEYFLVCEGVSIDQESNRASLFNVLEEMSSKKFPATIVKIIAISAWNKEPEDEGIDYQVMLRVVVPGDSAPQEFPTNMLITKPRHRLVTTIVGIRVPDPGDVVFEILLNGKHIASHTVSVLPIE